MKIRLVIAASVEAAATAIATQLKVNAPRRTRYRKSGGGAGWKLAQRKAQLWYKRNKPKLAQKGKRYRQKNKLAIERRAKFLDRAPKKPVVVRPNV